MRVIYIRSILMLAGLVALVVAELQLPARAETVAPQPAAALVAPGHPV